MVLPLTVTSPDDIVANMIKVMKSEEAMRGWCQTERVTEKRKGSAADAAPKTTGVSLSGCALTAERRYV